MIERLFGYIFLVAAAAILVRDGLAWHDVNVLAPESLNALWFDLNSTSLGLFRGAVLGTMPWAWHFGLGPLLSLWAGPFFLLLGIVLLVSARAARARRR
jgi:hypothetical protein